MIGRDRARDTFRRAWERVRSGDRGAVLYAGEAGIGKSRLLAELGAELVGQGVVVLAGRCDESVSLPYRPLVDALRPRLRTAALDELLPAVGPQRATSCSCCPSSRPGSTDRKPGVTPNQAGRSFSTPSTRS
jgi:hypothetical protein